MSNMAKVAAVCFELSDLFGRIGTKGVTVDDIPVLTAAAERARREIAEITGRT